MIRCSILCCLAACLVTSCDLPKKPDAAETTPSPAVQKTEAPVQPVTPVITTRQSNWRTPDDDLDRLPTRSDFVPTTDPQNANGAVIHVPPPADPKPNDVKPAESKPQ